MPLNLLHCPPLGREITISNYFTILVQQTWQFGLWQDFLRIQDPIQSNIVRHYYTQTQAFTSAKLRLKISILQSPHNDLQSTCNLDSTNWPPFSLHHQWQ